MQKTVAISTPLSRRINHQETQIRFKKTDKEIALLTKLKKEHNKKFQATFGTKRPSAGVVRRHLLES